MAKAKGGVASTKLTFGKRKGGKAAKSKGPKDKPVKKYKGQGKQYYYQYVNISKPLTKKVKTLITKFVIVNY